MEPWQGRRWSVVIFEKFFEGLGLVLGWILDLLPSTPAAPDLVGFVQAIFASDVVHWLRGVMGPWFPVDQLVAGLGVLGAWFVALAGFRLLSWFLALIHVGGTEAA